MCMPVFKIKGQIRLNYLIITCSVPESGRTSQTTVCEIDETWLEAGQVDHVECNDTHKWKKSTFLRQLNMCICVSLLCLTSSPAHLFLCHYLLSCLVASCSTLKPLHCPVKVMWRMLQARTCMKDTFAQSFFGTNRPSSILECKHI